MQQKFHCGMYILLSDEKHRFVRDNSKKVHGKSETNSVQEEYSEEEKQSENFYWKKICREKNSLIFSWTEFCRGLHTAVVFCMQSFDNATT